MSEPDPLVVGAWGSVAEPYASEWGPRFRPFLEDALAAFRPGPGPLWVPGCGPGDEARWLAERYPERRVLASDPAPEMLALARRRLAGTAVEVAAGGAAEPPAVSLGGIFSSFVLQLLPGREVTLQTWREALAPEGRAVLVFWPRQREGDAWGHLGRVMEALGKPRPDWVRPLEDGLPELGFALEDARDLEHEIAYPSPEDAWRLLCEACSLQVILRRVGDAEAARARDLWLADPGLEERAGVWVHRPCARLWVLRRS